jgi:hypothetical protein
VYRPNGGNGDLEVVAVISGFTPDYGPILTPKEIRPEEATVEDYGKARIVQKDGHTYRLEEPTEMKDERYVILNSGIADAWDIHYAVDLIHLHPDGPKVVADFKPSLARVVTRGFPHNKRSKGLVSRHALCADFAGLHDTELKPIRSEDPEYKLTTPTLYLRFTRNFCGFLLSIGGHFSHAYFKAIVKWSAPVGGITLNVVPSK